MDDNDLDALIADLTRAGWNLTPDDIERLAGYTDPMQAKRDWYEDNQDSRPEALTAAQRNL